MVGRLDDRSWLLLLERIRSKHCTPFVGAGISPNPLAAGIAAKWATTHDYPLPDSTDLARVAQFLAVEEDDGVAPKERLLAEFAETVPPDFTDRAEPHALLADLPLKMYITTNYDSYMVEALRARQRNPVRVVCRWNSLIDKLGRLPPPDTAQPWVFHLHGSDENAKSLVLTEDDYVDFLVSALRDRAVLPPAVMEAFSNTTLLFLGYSLTDWTFRVLFRGLVCSLPNAQRMMHLAVQLPRGNDRAEDYLDRYFGGMKVRVFWGTAHEFTRELRTRWEAFNAGLGSS